MRKRMCCLLLAFFTANSFANDSAEVIYKTVSEAQFTVVATDRNGRPVANLSANELSVFEDGRQVPDFALRPASNLPLRMGVLLDLSGSMRKPRPETWPTLSESLQRFLQPEDRVLVIAFDGKIELDQTVTQPQELDRIRIPSAGGLTALYDTLYVACGDPMFAEGVEPRRSALIVLSDGDDNLSRHSLEDVIAKAQSAGIAVYSISVQSSRLRSTGDSGLRELASASGGRIFAVAGIGELRTALTTIQDELRTSYLLYYRTLDQPGAGKFRSVNLRPTQNNGVTLRSRAGYYTSH